MAVSAIAFLAEQQATMASAHAIRHLSVFAPNIRW
jgi:hypothetical protein